MSLTSLVPVSSLCNLLYAVVPCKQRKIELTIYDIKVDPHLKIFVQVLSDPWQLAFVLGKHRYEKVMLN